MRGRPGSRKEQTLGKHPNVRKNGQKKDRLHNKRLQFTISWNRVVFG